MLIEFGDAFDPRSSRLDRKKVILDKSVFLAMALMHSDDYLNNTIVESP
jgi:hypothetical protein